MRGAELTDADNGEVHVYAHPRKPVTNLQQQKNDKVQYLYLKLNLYTEGEINFIIVCFNILLYWKCAVEMNKYNSVLHPQY